MGQSRMITSAILVSVVVLLFHFAGMLEDSPSGTGYVLNNLGLTNPQNFGGTTFWTTVVGIGAISLAGIAIGGYVTRSLEGSIFFGVGILLIPVFIGMGWDLILIANEIRQINNMLAVMIISPLFFAYGLTIYDWAMGRA